MVNNPNDSTLENRSDSVDIPLSVCVITLNEETNIERCLNSVQWSNDIVVVDSGSTDKTRDIASTLGARVIKHDWEGFRDQKQFSVNQAKYDWVLVLDADEVVSQDLSRAIIKLFDDGSPEASTSFKLNRLCHFLGRWIKHGSWHPDWIIRIFNRHETRFEGGRLHEYIAPTERIKKLEGNLLHYPYQSISENVRYGDYYSQIQARELDEKGKKGGVGQAFGHCVFKFLKDYVLKRGFLDGAPGLVIAVIGSFNVFLKYSKLWEKQHLNVDEEEQEFPRSQ